MAKKNENKMQPNENSVEGFLQKQPERRIKESHELIEMMRKLTGEEPVMWGESIIGFGSVHYNYASGREGDMPLLAFSPRKASLTVYFSEGFDHYGEELQTLGKHKTSVSCLYINKLEDVDIKVLQTMLRKSLKLTRRK